MNDKRTHRAEIVAGTPPKPWTESKSKIEFKLVGDEPTCPGVACLHFKHTSPEDRYCPKIPGYIRRGFTCIPGLRQQRDELKAKLEAALELDKHEAEGLKALVIDRLRNVDGEEDEHQEFCSFWGGLQDKLAEVIDQYELRRELQVKIRKENMWEEMRKSTLPK